MVETHSYRLSPLGPALQLGGGSKVISASSFCIRFAEVPSAFEIFGFGLGSLRVSSLVVAVPAADDEPPVEEFVEDPDEAGLFDPPKVELLALRPPRPVLGIEFEAALLVGVVVLAVPGGEFATRPAGAATDAVALFAEAPPLVVELEDIVELKTNERIEKYVLFA